MRKLIQTYRFSQHRHPGGGNSGFTLVELMVILAVAAIMTGIAIPSILNWLPNYRLKASARALYTDMQRAKLEAIKRNDTVIMTINAVGAGAPLACPAGGGGGYVFFIDNGDGGAGVADDNIQNGAEPIIATATMQQGVCVLSTTFAAGSGFGPRGLPAGGIGRITLRHTNNVRFFDMTQSMAGGLRFDN